MGRWEPGARERLEQAAMELFLERGFEQTTVAEIASRAGLTERTFFRYFADKREVLFSGAGELQELFVSAVSATPAATAPMDAVAAALAVVAPFLQERGAFASRRQDVITAHDDLRERELVKLASLASAIAATLRSKGVTEPAASLAAEAGIAVFKVAFERWQEAPTDLDFARVIEECLGELKVVTATS
ncbi:TetR/AcrR family transcriptional regulator [Allobranchiibius sp. GilTou38]|uniref:TetR/AcrR family transcriptional regulator n=1 Tax=Allobranchiibius sp. GilTou38 TaxID=2815210 RepID=UPI001AA1C9D0|nr:TetR/AcrR family transcriptional regulator [Allobranchiibius sp. GilTou38]MBO1768423.1 TetR family transcriptional regulator [Allobranchiibius sp. GilTou38]